MYKTANMLVFLGSILLAAATVTASGPLYVTVVETTDTLGLTVPFPTPPPPQGNPLLKPPPTTCAPTNNGDLLVVVLYEHVSYLGRQLCGYGQACTGGYGTAFAWVGDSFNDITSSVGVFGAGCTTAWLFEHIDYGGRDYACPAECPDLTLVDFNDITSSLIVY